MISSTMVATTYVSVVAPMVSTMSTAVIASAIASRTSASATIGPELSTASVFTEVSSTEVCSVAVPWVHASEEVASAIAIPSPWLSEIIVTIGVVEVDSEAPAMTIE
jgi:hypothetical protein